ncbi:MULTISPECIES: hypothetical protein [Sinorhizobium]|uniref:Uncharacterized protein n=1 Tax=Sinorhizobium americanum TaxID=194963 RepID=A0A2S3YVQ6_9HYPH|nr:MULTISPECIES: hypothetical protein [Sinorhizobium]PDT39778.1 hypothetical protein CO656_19100 [Sinorhizobium sp. FG01]POH35701.1 hypothetical protein ATY31_00230 [Sinorhizobium americanum]
MYSPAAHRDAEIVASILLDIEGSICDLRLMASIANELAHEELEPVVRETEDHLELHMTELQRERLLFAVGDVAARAKKLSDLFYEAFAAGAHRKGTSK